MALNLSGVSRQCLINPNDQSPIDAHGIIGDMRSAALVNDKGSVDFFCWPEFDSPSIFCSLLDTPEAGIFQLSPDLPDARREQIYLPDTNVLQTRWLSDRAVVEITDLLPIGDTEDDLPMLMRRVRVVSGQATFHLRCAVRHDYARAKHPRPPGSTGRDLRRRRSAVPAPVDGSGAADRRPTRRLPNSPSNRTRPPSSCSAPSTIRASRKAPPTLCLERTLKFWRDWIGQSNYRGRWREMVNRSALAMKLLTSRKHGAILAAATFGLPESHWRRAQLGLPLHLDPRRLVHRLRLHAPGFRRRGQRLHALVARAGQRLPRQTDETQYPVWHRRPPGTAGNRTHAPVRPRWRDAGAHRQPGLRPGPAGHLRRADGRGLPGQQIRRSHFPRGLEAHRGSGRSGLRNLAAGGCRHLGNARRAASSSCTRD